VRARPEGRGGDQSGREPGRATKHSCGKTHSEQSLVKTPRRTDACATSDWIWQELRPVSARDWSVTSRFLIVLGALCSTVSSPPPPPTS
jgi:hypothetical protein